MDNTREERTFDVYGERRAAAHAAAYQQHDDEDSEEGQFERVDSPASPMTMRAAVAPKVGPSGVRMPINVRNWVNVFHDDFVSDVPASTATLSGAFLDSPLYSPRWTAHKTGWKTSKPWEYGTYDNRILEVKDSCLVANIGTVQDTDFGTRPRVACPRPRVPRTPGAPATAPYSLTEGRFSVCVAIDDIPGYKVAFLLWPDSNVWPRDGELDWPEASTKRGGQTMGFMHRQGGTRGDDQDWVRVPEGVADGNFHVWTINWKRDWMQFVVDGRVVKRVTQRVPNTPMHWNLQIEPELGSGKHVPPESKGRVRIDWVSVFVPA